MVSLIQVALTYVDTLELGRGVPVPASRTVPLTELLVPPLLGSASCAAAIVAAHKIRISFQLIAAPPSRVRRDLHPWEFHRSLQSPSSARYPRPNANARSQCRVVPQCDIGRGAVPAA